MEGLEKTKAKVARSRGEDCTSYATKQQVPEYKVGSPCKCGGFEKIGIDHIQDIFDKFWGIGNYDHQTAYLNKLVHSVDIQRSGAGDCESRTKQGHTGNYSVMNN